MKVKKAIFCKLLINLLRFLFLSIISTPVFSIYIDEDIYRFSGQVINQQDSIPIASVHIINLSMAKGTTSSEDGSFSFSARQGDCILFSAVGFHTDTLIINENHLLDQTRPIIALKVRTYELSGIDVYPYSTYEEFKHEFLNFDHEDEFVINFDLRLPESERKSPPPLRAGANGTTIVIDGPITYLYDNYSRRGKEILKTRAAEAKYARNTRVARFITPAAIRQLTDLEDEEEIDEFLSFCSLDYDIIDSMRDYQVYQTLLDCYSHYKASK